MGFSVMASLIGNMLVSDSNCRRTLKLPLSSERNRTAVSIRFSNLAMKQGRIFLAKRDPAELEERESSDEVRKEINRCYELIHRLGRGAVYLGSARMGPEHSHYLQALELSKEVANLLNCTSWTGGGPGLMDAVTKGALQAGKPVGAFKIRKEAGEWTASNYHPYLPTETYLTCSHADI